MECKPKMKYTIKMLEWRLKVKYPTLAIYLSRAEFSHIKREVGKVAKKEVVYLNNVTDYDLIRLEQLISNRRTRSKRPNSLVKKEIKIEEAKRILRKIIKILDEDTNDVIKIIKIEDEIYKIKKNI